MASVGRSILQTRLHTLFFLDVPRIVWSIGFRSVVVITSASHAEGRRFESCRKQGFSGVYFGKSHWRPKRGDGRLTQLKISRF